MPRFPLDKLPKLGFAHGKGQGHRFFGAERGGGRKHAACDLIVTSGTPVLAVDSGVVVKGPYEFYHGAYAIEVRHPLFIVRYCEIAREGAATAGQVVKEGDVIGYVRKMNSDSMLHFEMYAGMSAQPEHAGLTQRSKRPYERREDVIDPTPYLLRWAAKLLTCNEEDGK